MRSSPREELDAGPPSGLAVVLAAHGAGDGSEVNDEIRARARRLAASGFDEVAVAFHKGTPGFSSVLSTLHSTVVVVVPVMSSGGYFAKVVLPRGLASDPAFSAKTVRVSTSLGLHPQVSGIVERRIGELARRYELGRPAVAIVGHGTPRHKASRASAVELASSLSRRLGGSVSAFFLDDEPPLEKAAAFEPGKPLLVVPFLIASGRHARNDLTARLGVEETVAEFPIDVRVGDRRILIDRPVGEDPDLDPIVADLARQAARQ